MVPHTLFPYVLAIIWIFLGENLHGGVFQFPGVSIGPPTPAKIHIYLNQVIYNWFAFNFSSYLLNLWYIQWNIHPSPPPALVLLLHKAPRHSFREYRTACYIFLHFSDEFYYFFSNP